MQICSKCQHIICNYSLFSSVVHFIYFPVVCFSFSFTHTQIYSQITRLTEPNGFIHDGLGNYSIGVKCSWLIDARDPYQNFATNISSSSSSSSSTSLKKKPKQIRLHLEEFATECSWDHLYIYDGDSVQSPLLAVFR